MANDDDIPNSIIEKIKSEKTHNSKEHSLRPIFLEDNHEEECRSGD